MKSFAKILAALILCNFTLACGGPVGDSSDEGALSGNDDLSSSEPMAWEPHAAVVAATVLGANPRLANLTGQIGPTDGFSWSFTFYSADGTKSANVAASGTRTASILSHQSGRPNDGIMFINPRNVAVTLADLQNDAAKRKMKGRLSEVQLSQVLAPNSHPIFIYDQGGQSLTVDAETGKVLDFVR